VEKLLTDPVVDKNKIKEHVFFSKKIWFTVSMPTAKTIYWCPVSTIIFS
jgi:hypothetical protein